MNRIVVDSYGLIFATTAESKIIFFSGQNITSALFVAFLCRMEKFVLVRSRKVQGHLHSQDGFMDGKDLMKVVSLFNRLLFEIRYSW